MLEAGEFDFAPHIQIEPDLLELFLATGIGSVEPLKASAVERVALEFGVEGIEVDVWTVGGRLVVIHDPTVNRTTNGRVDRAWIGVSLDKGAQRCEPGTVTAATR